MSCGITKKILIVISWMILGQSTMLAQGDWEQIQNAREGELNLVWFTSRPFIYQDDNGQLTGIEYEMIQNLQKFAQRVYGVELRLKWSEARSFSNILEQVRSEAITLNTIGVSAFSITDERKQFLKFTRSYLPDITVLVSSQGTPIVESYPEFQSMISDMEAVTIKGTSYEKRLKELQQTVNSEFDISYISSDQNVLDNISQQPNRFGFIDLPIYLMLIKQGGELVRQNYFTQQGAGYGFIMPKQSNWDQLLNAFLLDPDEQEKMKLIYAKYLGEELYEFMNGVTDEEQISTSILTKEKELQLELIKNANLKIEEEQSFKEVLLWGMIIAFILLLIIAILFYNNLRSTRKVMVQNAQIESQQSSIKEKNEQLVNRNLQLMSLNEERNQLIHIFAHDLRSPLNQIIGFTDLLLKKKEGFELEDQEIMEHIHEGGKRINTMITRILEDSVKGDQNKMMIRENVMVNDIIKEVVARYQPAAIRKNITVDTSSCEEIFEIKSDHLLLFLVLENLISNAIKFSPNDSSINVITVCQKDVVKIEVTDQGPGFTEEDRQLLFQPFQKLSARPTGGESSIGLGLSIVKKYIRDLGGEIWLDSAKGEGAKFTVSLPRN